MSEPPITHRGAVYPWECDQIGHMNVTWYVSKFDQATWVLFAMIGMTGTYFRDNDAGMGAVQYNVTYKREMRAGETLSVRSRIVEVRDKVMRYVHEMVADESGEVAAIAEVTAVHMDTRARRSRPFPPEIAARARAMMDEHRDLP